MPCRAMSDHVLLTALVAYGYPIAGLSPQFAISRKSLGSQGMTPMTKQARNRRFATTQQPRIYDVQVQDLADLPAAID